MQQLTQADRAFAAGFGDGGLGKHVGGISTLDSAASRQALADLDAASEQRAKAAESLRWEFLSAVSRGDANAVATFAGPAPVYEHGKRVGGRAQSLGEVVYESLDHADYAQRAMQVLVDAASGKVDAEAAKQLLEEAAAHWADWNAEMAS